MIGWRCLKWLTQEITEESIDNMDDQMLQIIEEWCKSGGQSTLNEIMALPKEEREEILEYLEEFRAYEEVHIGKNTFLLVHGGFEYDTFDAQRSLDDYDLDELVWTRMNLNEEYFPDKYIVFGHTPTCHLWAEEKGVSLEKILQEEDCHRIFKKGKLIGIDCGCAYDGYLGCLCLETMEEIYI